MRKKPTTIEVYSDDLPTWRRCCKKKKKSSKDAFRDLMNRIDCNVKFKRYTEELTTRDDYKRPLSGKKIKRCSKTIEK